MSITKVSHSTTTDPIDSSKPQQVINNATGGIMIDIITNVGGGDPLGSTLIEVSGSESKWFKIETGKSITLLASAPGGLTLRETYTDWDYGRFCVLTAELCYLEYTSNTDKDAAHRVFPFDGYTMGTGDYIIIEINVASDYAKVYY